MIALGLGEHLRDICQKFSPCWRMPGRGRRRWPTRVSRGGKAREILILPPDIGLVSNYCARASRCSGRLARASPGADNASRPRVCVSRFRSANLLGVAVALTSHDEIVRLETTGYERARLAL